MQEIDLLGPDGNRNNLLKVAKSLGTKLKDDLYGQLVVEEMQQGDYAHSIAVFKRHFKYVCVLKNEPAMLSEHALASKPSREINIDMFAQTTNDSFYRRGITPSLLGALTVLGIAFLLVGINA